MLWLKLDNSVVKARIGIVYMPQEETKTVKDLKRIYEKIEEEIETATKQNEQIILMGDLNCKVGKTIPGNVESITKGGRILLKMLNKHNLCLMNSEESCKGKWTRIEGNEKSVLDYVITRKEDKEIFKEMVIDEDKQITPYNVDESGIENRCIYTDHCMIKLKINWCVQEKNTRPRRRLLDGKRYEEFAKELEKEKVAELIDPECLQESYTRWSEKVMEVCEKFSIEKKKKQKT